MRLTDIAVRYARRGPLVLQGISATLEPGDTVVVEGRNGSGKSTLLRAIAGLRPLAAGKIADRPEVVGWVPESFPGSQPFVARAYLSMTGAVRGLDPATVAGRIAAVAECLHLTGYLDTPLAELSKGTLRKVALLQGLLVPPGRLGLLVADEAWDGLDAESQEQVPALLAEIADAGGIVVVTDHLGMARELPGVRHWRLSDAGELREVEPESETRGEQRP